MNYQHSPPYSYPLGIINYSSFTEASQVVLVVKKEKKVKVKSLSPVQLFATPWSLARSSVHGIFQARILECGDISSSRGSSRSRDRTHVCYIFSTGRQVFCLFVCLSLTTSATWLAKPQYKTKSQK